jgi:hypothetical protein
MSSVSSVVDCVKKRQERGMEEERNMFHNVQTMGNVSIYSKKKTCKKKKNI